MSRCAAGVLRVTCFGPSMLPSIRPGESLEVQPFGAADGAPAAGELVLLRSVDGHCEMLHRIVTRVPGTQYFVHCGDAPEARPGFVHRSRLIGRVSQHRAARAPVSLLQRGLRVAQAGGDLVLRRL